jgi:hypothetical protein
MTVEERVADFLVKNKGKAYCDDCLARNLVSIATKLGTPLGGSRSRADSTETPEPVARGRITGGRRSPGAS